MDYQERFKKVNAFCKDKSKTVWDSIDRPIRPLIYELNRVGLATKFSCCGFNYEDEEEPKSHHDKFAYVFICPPKTKHAENALASLKHLCKRIKQDNPWYWDITMHGAFYHLHVKNPPNMVDLYKKEDGLDFAIHDYEVYSIAIHLLTKNIKLWPSDPDAKEIIDGNRAYHEDEEILEWQVRPKRSISINIAKLKLERQLKEQRQRIKEESI